MAMELKIISPAEDGFIKTIEFNFDELKGELETRLEKYQGLAYTDDTIQEAKSDRATLNKFRKALDAKRLEIKRRCLEPYDAFEAKIKELTGMVDKPVQAIDSQVKGYEERKRSEKQRMIQALWDAQESDAKAMVKLADVFDQRWLNVTYPLTSVEKEITEFLAKVEEELDLIYQLHTDFEQQVIRFYLGNGFNVAQALAEDKKLKDAAAKQEEYRKQREAAKAAAEEARKQQEAARSTFDEPATTAETVVMPEPEMAPSPPISVEPVVRQVDFRVWATSEQLSDLKQFLTDNNIRYGRVEDDSRDAA